MAYCPNCADEIAVDSSSCTTCGAVFGGASPWKPVLEAPEHRDPQDIAKRRVEAERRRAREAAALADRTKGVASPNEASGSIDWLHVYMSVTVACHLGTIGIGIAGGSIGMYLVLYFLALPLFLPGFLVGIYCLATAAKGSRARIFLAIAVVALPAYEWHLLGTLSSGWRGS